MPAQLRDDGDFRVEVVEIEINKFSNVRAVEWIGFGDGCLETWGKQEVRRGLALWGRGGVCSLQQEGDPGVPVSQP